jgi:hypothetical protein
MAAGPDVEVAQAAKYLETLTPLFSKSDPPGALTAPLTWPLVVQLSATFGPAFVPGPQLCAGSTGPRATTPPPEQLPATCTCPTA